MTAIKNIVNIIIKPGQVFTACKNKQSWLPPFLIILLISLISSYILVPGLIVPEHLNQIRSRDDLNQEEKETALAYFNSSFHYFSTFLSTAFPKIIYYPVLAFFITLLPLLFRGKPVKYLIVFSGVVYTGIINSMGFFLDSILKLRFHSLDIGLNLALLFNSSNIFINSLLSKINIFGLWQIILLTILISVYYNYSKTKSFLIIFNFWAIIKLISGYFNYLKLIIN